MPLDRLTKIRELLLAAPTDDFLLFALAQEQRNRGDARAAIEAFEHLREVNPGYVGLYYHLAELLAAHDEPARARSIYETGIEVAQRAKDRHALAELRNAYANWEIERAD